MFNIKIQLADGSFKKLARVVITDKLGRFLIGGDDGGYIRIWVPGKRKCGIKQAMRKVKKLLKETGLDGNLIIGAKPEGFQETDYMILENKLVKGFSMELRVLDSDFNNQNDAIDLFGVQVI